MNIAKTRTTKPPRQTCPRSGENVKSDRPFGDLGHGVT